MIWLTEFMNQTSWLCHEAASRKFFTKFNYLVHVLESSAHLKGLSSDPAWFIAQWQTGGHVL